MVYRLADIEGIGQVYASRMAEAGVRTTEDLLERGAAPSGRRSLSEATGASDHLVLRWCNRADLMRIEGVGKQYAELLEAAGVDTVKELGNRNAENLAARMEEINQVKRLARTTPAVSVLRRWITQARMMESVLIY